MKKNGIFFGIFILILLLNPPSRFADQQVYCETQATQGLYNRLDLPPAPDKSVKNPFVLRVFIETFAKSTMQIGGKEFLNEEGGYGWQDKATGKYRILPTYITDATADSDKIYATWPPLAAEFYFHTHPTSTERGFSDQDFKTIAQNRLIAYVVDWAGIIRYDWHTRSTENVHIWTDEELSRIRQLQQVFMKAYLKAKSTAGKNQVNIMKRQVLKEEQFVIPSMPAWISPNEFFNECGF